MKQLIALKVNGESHEVAVAPRMTLLEVLRDMLGLTGTKNGCSLGNCGSCTVLLNGKPVASCLVLAVEAQGKEVMTIEGLAQNGELHPMQQAFIEHGALQCGFCTPGMLLSAKALLDENPSPTENDVKEAISGNLCRCTGYTDAVNAVLDVAERMKEAK
jgi:carbon-monoxide dehydrogenase small subunit